jgi:hypothetical protein
MNLTIRIPDGVHGALKRYRDKEKPHLSLNALIVEAIIEEIGKNGPVQAAPAAEAAE